MRMTTTTLVTHGTTMVATLRYNNISIGNDSDTGVRHIYLTLKLKIYQCKDKSIYNYNPNDDDDDDMIVPLKRHQTKFPLAVIRKPHYTTNENTPRNRHN
mmetsp:Transcript_20477/g.25317  ORF Transcript_20477/g.25317 Transcript_20477/m.25317 type:complete len:100 (-) Transcript_20477:2243-2542(-)